MVILITYENIPGNFTMQKSAAILLSLLQQDSSQSVARLAELSGMSPSACHRRIKQFEQSGVITAYSAQIDPQQIGLSLTVFVAITLESQSREAMESFEDAVARFDDILECHLTSGEADYQLRVAARDLAHFDRIHRDCLARLPGVSTMHSSFAIRRIKRQLGYPISAINLGANISAGRM